LRFFVLLLSESGPVAYQVVLVDCGKKESSVYAQYTRVTDRQTDGTVISVADRLLLCNAR